MGHERGYFCISEGPNRCACGDSEYGIEDIIADLVPLIRETLVDGQRKRPPTYWKVDPGHPDSMHRHLHRYDMGEKVDADSGAHPLQHAGVRALMQAWQETHDVRP